MRKWNVWHALLMLAGAGVTVVFQSLLPFLIVAIVSFVSMCVLGFRQVAHLDPPGGWANWLTVVRLALLLVIGFTAGQMATSWLVALALIIIIADGLDGYLARRLDQQTAFGALLDLEVDAFFGAFFSILIWLQYDYGAWLLVPGLLRYAFVLLLVVLRWTRRPKVEMVEGKTIAVLFFLALLTPFVIAPAWAKGVLVLASLAIVYSFLKELILLAGHEQRAE